MGINQLKKRNLGMHQKTGLICIILMAGFLTQGFAQDLRSVYAPVIYVYENEDSNKILVSTHVAGWLKAGQQVTLKTKANKKENEDFDETLGKGQIEKSNDSFLLIRVTLQKDKVSRGIKVGDLVKMEVIDSVFLPQHYTGFILNIHLVLHDQYNEKYFDPLALAAQYKKNPDQTDAWLLDTLFKDLQDFYAENKNIFEAESLTKPSPKGRYAGKSAKDVFEKLTKKDVGHFLSFMISFPGKYIGNPYKFNETFATWLINDGPAGGQEVLQYFHEVKGDSLAFAKKLKTMPWLLEEKGIAYNTGLAANENRCHSEALADEEYKAAIWYSQQSGDMRGAGLVYLFIAENFQNKELFSEAFDYCRKGTEIYEQLKDYDRLLDLYFKQAYLYYNTSGYDPALQQLAKTRQILKTQKDALKDYTIDEGWRKYFDYTAFTWYKAGSYSNALNYIDSSFTMTRLQDDVKSLKSRAFNETVRGNIFTKQETYDRALTAYKNASDTYKNAGDDEAAESLENDMGILLSKQGKYKESNDKLLAILPVFLSKNQKDNAGLSYSQIGQNYWNLKQYDSAIASHNISINLRRQNGNRSGQAFSWEQLGSLYKKAGLKIKALDALDSAAALYEAIGSRAEAAAILLEAGKVYKNDQENEKAASYYKKAANTLAALGKKDDYSDALFELGSLTMESDPKQSMIYYDSCRLVSLEAGLKAQAAYAMMNLGILNKYDGKISAGKKWYADAKILIEALNESHALAFYYTSLARDEEWELNLESANAFYRKAIEIFDSTNKARALQFKSSIAANYQNMGQYNRAERLLDSALAEAQAGRYLLELGTIYQNKAWMLLQQGQTETGMALADSAAKYYEETGNTNSLASIYALRGDFNRKLFNFKEAFNWYCKSDSLFGKYNNPWARSAGMINFVVLFYYQGDYQKSLDYTHKALAIRPFLLEDQLYVDLQGALAENHYYLGNTDSSRFLLKKYLPVARTKKLVRSVNFVSLMLGRIAVDEKHYQEAIPLLQVATSEESAKNDLIIYQQAVAYLGMAYRGVENKDSAGFYFNLAVKTARIFEIPSFSWEALYQAGLDAYQQEEYVKAIPLLKEAVAMVNKQAANLYGGDEAGNLFKKQAAKSDLYFKLMSALTKTGQKEEAWQYANLSQAAALSDLAGGIATGSEDAEKQKALKTAQEKFQQLQSVGNALQQTKKDSLGRAGQIIALEKTQNIAEAEYLNYIEQLKKDYPELGTFFANQVNPEKFRNLHTYLPEDMAMLMFVVNDRELMIFWATQENTGIVTGTIPTDFFNTTAEWLKALKNPNRPAGAGPLVLRTQIGKVPNKTKPTMDVKTGAEQLFELLLAPVLPEIKDKKSWCLIPNGKLTHLPFHALGHKNEKGDFEYIAATKNIFYTNSPNELFLPWNRRNRASFAAFGNPDNTLQSAGVEVNKIASFYETAQVYTEKNATVEQATESLTTMHYVHFATHGVLNYNDFDSSYLVFAPDPGADHGGKLTLYDIRRLNIKGCDLVTLSACETAVSAEVSKGWYISPANAFLINRVRSVVASLWEVDDQSTNYLMQSFYKNLQQHPKVEALRMAMQEVSQMPGYEHPFFWAGFVLYGDWQ